MSSLDGLIDKTVTQGDTLPLLEGTLTDANGVINLTGATVKLKMRGVFDTALKVNAICTIVDPLAGTVSYQWLAVDVDTPGEYYVSYEIIFADLKETTCPNNFYRLLEIIADLG